MKVVILAGGLGTRLAEETELKPKPMVEIGGRPILWHIIKHYARYGFNDFVIALGYRGEVIKQYFRDYDSLSGDMTIQIGSGVIQRHVESADDWKIHLIDTGPDTNTGGRIRRLRAWLQDETFLLTYGDGVSDVDLHELIQCHRRSGRIATLTAVRPPARFGGLVFDGDLVSEFTEKPQIAEGWINGGYMVMEPSIFEYLESDTTSLESHALEQLATKGQLAAYRHGQFWQCMDTLRDKRQLEQLWRDGHAPWKVWRD